MFEGLMQLTILFFVIFDPLASFAVFLTATSSMSSEERRRTANLAVITATSLSVFVFLFGENLLGLLNTNMDEFKVAGGIILGILGMKMALGHPLVNIDTAKNNSARAIAAIIGTPLLTGPAAMTSIMIACNDYGYLITGTAVGIVLVLTSVIFWFAQGIDRFLGRTTIQMISTFLGLVTLAWGVRFVTSGLQAILS